MPSADISFTLQPVQHYTAVCTHATSISISLNAYLPIFPSGSV